MLTPGSSIPILSNVLGNRLNITSVDPFPQDIDAFDQLFVLYFNIQYKCLKLYTAICGRETVTMAYLVTKLSPCIYFMWEKE